MNTALYEEGIGYYTSPNNRPFGQDGDFITAPTLSNHLARALVDGWQPLLQSKPCTLIELGAGDGTLAAQICKELKNRQLPLESYKILEISAHLRQEQKEKLKKETIGPIEWIDHLPSTVDGIIFGNEIIDAIPCELLHWQEQDIWIVGLTEASGELTRQHRRLSEQEVEPCVLARAQELQQRFIKQNSLPYTSEIHCQAEQFFEKTARALRWGLIQLIDYGFEESVYYMPSRATGTIMCHRRQQTHAHFLEYIGQQDISVHVNFSRLAEIADRCGLILCAYLSQAQFFMNTLLNPEDRDEKKYNACTPVGALQILMNPHEMGELFKTIVWEKNVEIALPAFSVGDRSYKL